MIKAFVAWLHRITAPPVEVEVRVGDVWVSVSASPWDEGYVVLDVAEGWVKFRNPHGNVHAQKCDCFREGMKLQSRAE